MVAKCYSPVEMLAELVGFDTTSRVSNLGLIRFVEAYLASHGVRSELVYDAEGGKANLVATVGPDVRTGVVLSGHSDVVPVDDQVWSTDPFELVLRDGKLYGRGACDMKGFIATVLSLVPEFKASALQIPVHIVITYDEETTCGGAQRLMPELLEMGFAPRAVIVGEPTMMQLVNAHKGVCAVQTRVTGQAAHTSMPQLGVNAIAVAAELIAYIGRLQQELVARPSPLPGFDPPHTTLTVGLIDGGTQFNIVPGECRFGWDIRFVPGDDPLELVARVDQYAASLLPQMQAVTPGADIQSELLHQGRAFEPDDDSAAVALVKAVTGVNQTLAVGFATEAVYYQQAGMPVVVYGPGNIEQAHKPDEFISVDQLQRCEAFLRNLMQHLQR